MELSTIILPRFITPAPDPRDAVVIETNIWEVFTNMEDYPKPWRLKHALCKHCCTGVTYNKRSQQVIEHLKNCEKFKEYCIV